MGGAKERKRVERKYLPEFVYGSMDGVITTFAVVSGVVGAALSPAIILILGFANLAADGFSMSLSNYMSVKSQNELSRKLRKSAPRTAIATFLSFVFMGLIPLLSFVIASVTGNSYFIRNQFWLAVIFTGVALLIIGWLKGIVTEKHRVKSAIQTFVLGSIAAFLAFIAGKGISILLR
ncbi:MAG: VIT1/CCC1 transporter family protein [Nanoarchaeota archaeon]|nr:VIT1/CCC1 transporter family protein [Nanoarchaeota archaeon]